MTMASIALLSTAILGLPPLEDGLLAPARTAQAPAVQARQPGVDGLLTPMRIAQAPAVRAQHRADAEQPVQRHLTPRWDQHAWTIQQRIINAQMRDVQMEVIDVQLRPSRQDAAQRLAELDPTRSFVDQERVRLEAQAIGLPHAMTRSGARPYAYGSTIPAWLEHRAVEEPVQERPAPVRQAMPAQVVRAKAVGVIRAPIGAPAPAGKPALAGGF